MEEDKNTKSNQSEKIVVFCLGDEEFGVNISQVNRIIKIGAITRVPDTPPHIVGVLNLRGKIIVMINLAKKLGLPSKEYDKNTRVINVESSNTVTGMIVDSATELLIIDQDMIRPAPPMIAKKIHQDYLRGVAIIDERVLILIDLTKVLDSEDFTSINEMHNAQNQSNSNEKDNNKSEEETSQNVESDLQPPAQENIQ